METEVASRKEDASASASAGWSRLREARDYRAFLSAYLEVSSLTFSDFARATGFHRGFPGDVISGRRRLTAKSYLAFERALRLPASAKRLFRSLVAREEPNLFPGGEAARVESAIRELRAKPWTRVRKRSGAAEGSRSLFSNPDAFSVFAAAGTAERGADLAKIAERTRLEPNAIHAAIAELRDAGLLVEEGGIYRPQDTHVFLKTSGNDEAFAELFRSACALASARASRALQSEEELFLASTFCVEERRLPELKKALRKTLLQFIDESIDSDGSRVVRLVSSLFV